MQRLHQNLAKQGCCQPVDYGPGRLVSEAGQQQGQQWQPWSKRQAIPQQYQHRKAGKRQSMVVRNNDDVVFLLPRRTIEELFHMVVSVVVLLVVWDIAALVCIGFVVGTHLLAHPDEPLLLPNESALLVKLLEQHDILPAATGSNCTDSTGSTSTIPISWADFWAAVPIVLDDATATQVVWQRLMHLLCKADWWRLTMCVLAAVIVLRTYCFGYTTLFGPRHHHDDDDHNDRPTKHLRELVAAALQRMATREGHGGGKGASPTTATTAGADVCGICLDGLLIQKNNVVVEGCHCRHAFHDHCIADWLCRGGYQCPLCRQDFLDAATTRKLRRCHYQATSTTSHHHGYFFS
jgi:hypothetical protein